MKKTPVYPTTALVALSLLLGFFALAGCQSHDWAGERRTNSESYRHNLLEETQKILAGFSNGLALTDCVAIAQMRSTKLLSSQIAEKIATVDRDATFSAFLPQVQVSFDTLSLSKQPDMAFNGESVQTQDQSLHRGSVQILQPIFTPAEWLMYRSAQRGKEIAGQVRERTGQMIELSIASLFYQCCSLNEDVAEREKTLAAARQLFKQAEAFRAAQYATATDVARAHAAALESERQCAQARREAQLALSRLLQAMNLWPLATVTLKQDALPDETEHTLTIHCPGEAPRIITSHDLLATPVENWMFQALLSRPEMSVQDRTIALRRNEVIRSLAMFLPNIVGFANYYKTSDSITVNKEYWGTGLQASLSAFNGFRDVESYLRARQQEKEAYVEREETAMMILVQVLESYKNLQDAQQALDVADASAIAAEKNMADVESQHRNGLVELSRLMEAQATCAEARARRRTAQFANAVALYAFFNVLGNSVEEVRTPVAP